MRKTTESKKEKIINFCKENKDTLGELIAIFIFGSTSIAFLTSSLDNPLGIKVMLGMIVFYVLWIQFCIQRTYYEIKELKEQEKNKWK